MARELATLRAAVEPRPWEVLPEGDGTDKGGARPKQLPPDHPRHHLPDARGYKCSDYNPQCTGMSADWTKWIYMGGRGVGKTRTGAEWSLSMALSQPEIIVAVCAPTFSGVRDVCFEDITSGIIHVARKGEITDYNRNNLCITLRNGSKIQGITAQNPDSVRGYNLSYAWYDEAAMSQYDRFYDYGLLPALRIKPKYNEPRLLITTTPRRSGLVRRLIEEHERNPSAVHFTRSISDENPYFSKLTLKMLHESYAGTYLERQELLGEYIEEADGALFFADKFAECRIHPDEFEKLELRQIVVAIDPASSAGEKSDDAGVIVAAEGINHHYYVLEDCSCRGTAEVQMSAVATAYRRWNASYVVAESQGVKDYLRFALEAIDPGIPLKFIPAMKSKMIRAQPISILAAQGRIHMVGKFEELEKQLVSMTSFDDRTKMHDDRADAFVWAMRELSSGFSGSYMEVYGFSVCTGCGADVHERDKECRQCRTAVMKKEKPVERDRSTRWAAAYEKHCEYGHVYPFFRAACPECAATPEIYLGKILAFTAGNPGGHGYSGRNPLQGRKILDEFSP
jgi:phage terminase large subunit-like protein/ribosomal protein L40E